MKVSRRPFWIQQAGLGWRDDKENGREERLEYFDPWLLRWGTDVQAQLPLLAPRLHSTLVEGLDAGQSALTWRIDACACNIHSISSPQSRDKGSLLLVQTNKRPVYLLKVCLHRPLGSACTVAVCRPVTGAGPQPGPSKFCCTSIRECTLFTFTRLLLQAHLPFHSVLTSRLPLLASCLPAPLANRFLHATKALPLPRTIFQLALTPAPTKLGISTHSNTTIYPLRPLAQLYTCSRHGQLSLWQSGCEANHAFSRQ